MVALPAFAEDGLLPPADYELTLDELRESLLVVGPGADYPNWDVAWRRLLVDNLGILPSAFRQSRRDGKPRGIVKIGGAP